MHPDSRPPLRAPAMERDPLIIADRDEFDAIARSLPDVAARYAAIARHPVTGPHPRVPRQRNSNEGDDR